MKTISFVSGIPYLQSAPELRTETFTLDQTDHIVPAKVVLSPGLGLQLQNTDAVTLVVQGSVPLINGTDFVVSGNDVSWSGKFLETVLVAGDVVQVSYMVIPS